MTRRAAVSRRARGPGVKVLFFLALSTSVQYEARMFSSLRVRVDVMPVRACIMDETQRRSREAKYVVVGKAEKRSLGGVFVGLLILRWDCGTAAFSLVGTF